MKPFYFSSIKTILFIAFLTFSTSLIAQDFMMQGWYWDYPKTADGANWANTLEGQAADIGQAGFTYVWLPPLSRASYGNGSNGYDPKDLYDLGEFGGGPTGFGTRNQVDDVITAFNNNGVDAVADVVYNHRDGGAPEDNPAVEGWIKNLSCGDVNGGQNAFPSDRYRAYLPLGGASGNGAGTYYFKIRSASRHPNFYNNGYKLYMETNTVGFQAQPAVSEAEPNGGGDCGQGNNTIQLGIDLNATIDNVGSCSGSCGIDEFALTINASDFNASGDTIWIFMNNTGGYSDHFIAGVWDGSADIQSQVKYQTYTDFSNLPSGQGAMNYTDFKPNGNPTLLNGDWDFPWFFYDYDQSNSHTTDVLNEWSEWLWQDVGIRGYRMDAVKHFDYAYTGDLMDYLHDNAIDPGMVVGEFFDFSAGTLAGWVTNVEANMDADTKAAINVRAFDFDMRSALKNACDAFGYDVRNVFNAGMVNAAGSNSYNVVTFVNNHDFRDGDQPVQNDPMLAYAYILTNNQIGLPCVFYPDYFAQNVPNSPNNFLKAEIDELMQIHKDYIFQSSSVDYLSRIGTPYGSNYIEGSAATTMLYQLTGGIGGKEVIVAINFSGNTLKVDHTINTANLPVGTELADFLGNSNFPTAVVSGSNQIYIELPARSYSVWINDISTPLPVELSRFEVYPNKDEVSLQWTSTDEIDLETYEIQRSLDAQRYEKIGNITAQGYGLYGFDDLNPILNQDLYYRLKMIDKDGQFEFSPIRTTRISKGISDLKLAPNPTMNNATLSFESQAPGDGLIGFYDVHSKLVSHQEMGIQTGTNTFDLETNALLPGVYFISIKMGETIEVRRLVKY